MRYYLRKSVIAIIGLYTAAALIPTVSFGSDYKNVIIAIASLLVVSIFIKPLFSLILIPINFITFISITLILNTMAIFALTFFLPGFTISAYKFPGANLEGVIISAYSFSQLSTTVLFAAIITSVQKNLHIIFE